MRKNLISLFRILWNQCCILFDTLQHDLSHISLTHLFLNTFKNQNTSQIRLNFFQNICRKHTQHNIASRSHRTPWRKQKLNHFNAYYLKPIWNLISAKDVEALFSFPFGWWLIYISTSSTGLGESNKWALDQRIKWYSEMSSNGDPSFVELSIWSDHYVMS